MLAAGLALAASACGKAPERAAAPPPAPPPAAPDARVDAALQAMFAESGAPAMVVAIVQGDSVTIRGFGHRATGDPRAPDGATLVRLQSISKLLASDLAARLAGQCKLKLTDPLQLYAPPGAVVPQVKGARPLELVDLATHTSGLGRNSPPTWPRPPTRPSRRAGPGSRRRRLPPPGTRAHYSNLGFDLLGDALAAAAKAPYGVALEKWVTGPLAMNSTTAQPTAAQCARMMTPDPSPRPVRAATPAPRRPAAGSTPRPPTWPPGSSTNCRSASRARPEDQPGDLCGPPRLSSQEGLDVAGPPAGVGLAWIQLAPTPTHPMLLEKTGGGGGFMTYIAIAPGRRVGMFVAINKMGFRQIKAMAARTNDLIGALAAGK